MGKSVAVAVLGLGLAGCASALQAPLRRGWSGAAPRSAVATAEDMAVVSEVDKAGLGFARHPGFVAAEAAAALASTGVLGLAATSTGGHSGLQAAAVGLLGLHGLAATAAGLVASSKEREVAPATLRGLLGGAVSLLALVQMKSGAVLANEAELRRPPLATGIYSAEMEAKQANDAVMLSSTYLAREDQTGKVAQLLQDLLAACEAQPDLVWSCFVNEDAQERRHFTVLQKFPSVNEMILHQKSDAFATFSNAILPLLEEPVGFYALKDRNGVFSEPVYPFGPGGEGGRDDAIYSSPANLDGSQTGTRLSF